MNFKRVLSGAVLIILTLVFFSLGGPFLLVALFLLSVGALYEFSSVLSSGGSKEGTPLIRPLRLTVMLLSLVWFLLIFYLRDEMWNSHLIMYFLFGATLILMLVGIFTYPGRWFADIALTLFALVYITLFFSSIYLIRSAPGGQFYVWYVIAAAWGSDAFAYVTGMIFGKHQLAPKLSPKKTIEGAVGGVVFGIVLCLIYGMIITNSVQVDRAPMLKLSLVIGLVGSISAEIGDLFASSIKRVMGIKDFSSLIPGHGGILDRFDSVLVTAPIILVLLDLFKAI